MVRYASSCPITRSGTFPGRIAGLVPATVFSHGNDPEPGFCPRSTFRVRLPQPVRRGTAFRPLPWVKPIPSSCGIDGSERYSRAGADLRNQGGDVKLWRKSMTVGSPADPIDSGQPQHDKSAISHGNAAGPARSRQEPREQASGRRLLPQRGRGEPRHPAPDRDRDPQRSPGSHAPDQIEEARG